MIDDKVMGVVVFYMFFDTMFNFIQVILMFQDRGLLNGKSKKDS